MKFNLSKKLNNNIIRLNLTGKPKVDYENFEELDLQKIFGIYADKAIELNKKGYIKLQIKEKKFLNSIDNLRRKLDSQVNSLFKKNSRLQDGWENKNFKEIKELACNKEILRVLFNVYGRKPFPFQTLNFCKGSTQHVHSDCVHFNSMPNGFMCGVWIALEDIHPDSGPLIYFPRSHKLPILNSRSLNLKNEDIKREPNPQIFFESIWRDLIKKNNFSCKKFIAKKGEILIWHSNLLHGGSSILNNELTRWSQVTHYFFDKCAYKRPFYETTDISNELLWFKPKNINF